jgi:hypothetical protein
LQNTNLADGERRENAAADKFFRKLAAARMLKPAPDALSMLAK